MLDIKTKANSQRFLTQSRLHSFDCSLDEALKTIRAFEVNKAHGHRHVASGERGRGLLCPFFSKLRESALILFIYGLSFSFKMLF